MVATTSLQADHIRCVTLPRCAHGVRQPLALIKENR